MGFAVESELFRQQTVQRRPPQLPPLTRRQHQHERGRMRNPLDDVPEVDGLVTRARIGFARFWRFAGQEVFSGSVRDRESRAQARCSSDSPRCPQSGGTEWWSEVNSNQRCRLILDSKWLTDRSRFPPQP
jgi:hypothetical protein